MLGWTINFHIFRGIKSSYPYTYSIPLSILHDTRALKILYETKNNVKRNKMHVASSTSDKFKLKRIKLFTRKFNSFLVKFNNRKVQVKNAILSPYNSLDPLRRWFNDEVIKESRRTCRDIKRVSTSRTRRCARSLEELLIEIEKKKENREGGKKREAREEKKKRKKGEGKKKTGLTVKRLPTQSVSFAFQKVIDTLKEIALISTDDSSPLKRYSEKIPLYSSRNEAASNSFSFFYIFPFDSHRSISLNTERPPREEKNRIQRFSIDSSTEIKSNIAYNVIRWRQRPATKLQLPQASFNFINHARSSRVSPGPN